MNPLTITTGDIPTALSIMLQVTTSLNEQGSPLWNPQALTTKQILANAERDHKEILVGWKDTTPVATMIIQWHDPDFWQDSIPFQAAYIHKLAVIRTHKGQGYGKAMIDHIETLCLKKNIHTVRLDCAADRPKLCKFYENLGFIQVDRRMVSIYDTAFYEKILP